MQARRSQTCERLSRGRNPTWSARQVQRYVRPLHFAEELFTLSGREDGQELEAGPALRRERTLHSFGHDDYRAELVEAKERVPGGSGGAHGWCRHIQPTASIRPLTADRGHLVERGDAGSDVDDLEGLRRAGDLYGHALDGSGGKRGEVSSGRLPRNGQPEGTEAEIGHPARVLDPELERTEGRGWLAPREVPCLDLAARGVGKAAEEPRVVGRRGLEADEGDGSSGQRSNAN
jgi:hypothetical protein